MPLNGPPFQPLTKTPAEFCPPEHHDPEKRKHAHEKKATRRVQLISCNVYNPVNPPVGLVRPSWRQLQWTRYSPSESHDLH